MFFTIFIVILALLITSHLTSSVLQSLHFGFNSQMEFSKAADTCFTWILTDFDISNNDSLQEKTYTSTNFTTLKEPNRNWHLLLSVNKVSQIFRSTPKCDNSNCSKKTITKTLIDLKMICNESIPHPEDMRVDISIKNNFEKLTRSFIISGKEKEFGFENFIDCEAMLKMVHQGKLEIFVEMFFHNSERIKFFDIMRNSEFLSDIQILIAGCKFYAHKAVLAARSPFFYQVFQQNKEIAEIKNLDIMPKAFMEILKYIYSNNLEKWYLSCDILIGATILQMEDLKLECENYLRNNLSLDYINTVLIVSVECNTKFLLKHCLQYVIKNIGTLRKLKNFNVLKTKPLVILRILQEIFEQFQNGKITIIDNINFSHAKVATNTSNYLLQDYETFLNNENLSDITIRVGEKNYQGHKVILAAKSPVLRDLITKNMKDNSDVIEIKDVKVEIFDDILRYMYTGKLKNLQEHGVDILKAANQYNLEHLKKMCEEFLVGKLTHENVVDILRIADTCNASFLVKYCSHYIVKCMLSYSQKKEIDNRITLDMFINCKHNIFYEFLDAVSKCCQVIYT